MDVHAIVELLTAPETRVDPYPLYEQAHRLGPVLRASDTFAVVTGYAAVDRVLRDRDFGVIDRELTAMRYGDTPEPPSLELFGRSILQTNQPAHARMRAPIAAVFTPRRIAALRPAVERAVDRLLAGLAEAGRAGGPVDFMDRFAFPLPIGVICELLGVPEADRHWFRGSAHDLTTVLEFLSAEVDLTAADRAAVELRDYFAELAAERRAHPREDLVSALVARQDANPDGGITDAELVANLVLVLVAGFETTTNLLGNGLALLFGHANVRAALAEGTLPVGDFVEEVLRYDSPVQLTWRIALRDGLDVEGVAVPRGGEVLLLIGAANRDPRRFPEPQRFDPWRAEITPLSFGAGLHYCIGAMLARLEATVAFRKLPARFPALAPAPGATYNDRLLLRGYGTFPITPDRA